MEQEQSFAIALLPSAGRVAEEWQLQQDRHRQEQLLLAEREAQKKIAAETSAWRLKELVMEGNSQDQSEQLQSCAVEKTKISPARLPIDINFSSSREEQTNTGELGRERDEGEKSGEVCQIGAGTTAEQNVSYIQGGSQAHDGVGNDAAYKVDLEPPSIGGSGLNSVGVSDCQNPNIRRESEVYLSILRHILLQYLHYAILNRHAFVIDARKMHIHCGRTLMSVIAFLLLR